MLGGNKETLINWNIYDVNRGSFVSAIQLNSLIILILEMLIVLNQE